MRDAARTLVLPFETGALAAPAQAAPWLFVNAEPVAGWSALTHAVQDHRGLYLELQRAGFSATPDFPGGRYAGALVLVSKSRDLSQEDVADAVARVQPGGFVVVAGEKNLGIQSLRKRMSALVPVDDSMAKHHATVFWFRVPADAQALAGALRPAAPQAAADGLRTATGSFSQGRVDEGSRLLAGTLPSNLKGRAADFGAGWGYLSVALCRASPAIASIELFEVSNRALAAARDNMAAHAPACPATFQWHDLVGEAVERRFDVVVMNPPFHHGRAADPAIGQAFVEAASRALVPGGRLFTVANRQLPYEKVLAKAFRVVKPMSETSRFKLFEAIR